MEIVRHDLAKDPPTRAQLEAWIDGNRLEDFINRRSPAYKERGLASRKLTKAEAIELMLEEPNLIRRPIVIRGGRLAFGYDEKAWDSILER